MRLESVKTAALVATATTALSFAVLPAPALANSHLQAAPIISESEWASYTNRFLERNGRIVDIEKSGVSHSEGQGYGMILAVYANDEAGFRRMLNFTFNEMRGRKDGLISWLYNPHTHPRIADPNNASDGDVLVAYALVKAAVQWNDASYLKKAEPLIDAIGRHLLVRHGDMVLLKPAAFGFDPHTHSDGPVVNLSYFIYGAFPLFAEINDRHPWIEAWQSGLMLTARSLAGREALAPDWITLRRERYMEPASGFAKKSSYDAVRIPLYMMLGGRVPTQYLAPFDHAWNVRGNGAPLDYDLKRDRKIMDMNDLGYRAIAALTACAVRGEPLPGVVSRYRNTTYFSSSLHLLTLAAARLHYPDCVALPGYVDPRAEMKHSRRSFPTPDGYVTRRSAPNTSAAYV
ncbi:MAG: glycosyl hydrolase family 8, partial [Pseudomonadota bacterium]